MRPLRPSSILIADARLGGVSATLSAYDSLVMRGYDVAAVVGLLPEPSTGAIALDNLDAISRYLARSCPGSQAPPVISLPHLVPGHPDAAQGREDLKGWLQAAQPRLLDLHGHLRGWHERRVQRLREMPARARQVFWWPFTQQKNMVDGDVTVIDARAGESFQVVQPAGAAETASAVATGATDETLVATDLYDGCASWWTQGVRGEAQPAVHRQMAYGAGRYGHVIFPEAVHEPALALSERLLATVGRGWASKVFFSDDGCGPASPRVRQPPRRHLFVLVAVCRRLAPAGHRPTYHVTGTVPRPFLSCPERSPPPALSKGLFPIVTMQGLDPRAAVPAARHGSQSRCRVCTWFPTISRTRAISTSTASHTQPHVRHTCASIMQSPSAHPACMPVACMQPMHGSAPHRPACVRRSTAVEVALKMAFKKFARDHGVATAGAEWRGLQVLALDGGYHGDTLGVMDCSPESVFNGGQTPWYRPRGLFLSPPTLGLVRGAWQVRRPRAESAVCA